MDCVEISSAGNGVDSDKADTFVDKVLNAKTSVLRSRITPHLKRIWEACKETCVEGTRFIFHTNLHIKK